MNAPQPIAVRDLVTIGDSNTIWTVTQLWPADGPRARTQASLRRPGLLGDVETAAHINRLKEAQA